MSIKGWTERAMNVPRGMWSSLLNRKGGTPSRASTCQNMRIRFGTARSRPGTLAAFSSTGKVTGMFNWITPSGENLVLYQDGDAIKVYDQALATSVTLLSGLTTTRSPSFSPLDVWTYFCGSDTAGNGTFQCEIFDGVNTDKAFRSPPVITGWTAVDGGAGQCTQGQHFLGFVYQNRTGYTGIPVTSSIYSITSATNASPTVVDAPGNNLQNGQQITIAGATGNTAINGKRIVTSVSGSTFQLTDTDGNVIDGNGAYAGGGTVSNPIQITLSAGLRQINISVGLPALPDGGTSANGGVQATLFLIATRADNPAIYYFMPTDAQTGQVGKQPVPLNTPVTLNFVMSFSDEDIAASLSGDTAQKNFLLLAQDANGVGPFSPNFVVAYGQRMCYGAGTTLYVSDIATPQQIAADTNAIRMQNQRVIAAAFPLPGNTNLYVTGLGWTGYVTDNNDSPSTWPGPLPVSDLLGAEFANCVCYNTGGPWVWIVTEGGPYLFDGQFAGMPLTYLCSGLDQDGHPVGWNRVNWNAAYTIQIRDDVKNFKLYIAVPMDDFPEPNYMWCIDYRMGKTFDSCDISLDVFTPPAYSSIAVVREVATKETNLWIGPAEAGIVRRFDISTHNDLGNAIACIWESGLMRGNEISTSMIRVGYLDLWMRGNSPLDAEGQTTMGLAISSRDRSVVIEPELQDNMGIPAALVPKPGNNYSAKFDLAHVPDFFIAIQTDAVDQWMEISSLTAYIKPDLANR